MRNLVNRSVLALQTVASPPPGASPSQIRFAGLIAWGLGLGSTLVVALLLPRLQPVIGNRSAALTLAAAVLVAHGLMVLGAYRMLTGKPVAVRAHHDEVSLTRVVVGAFATIVSLALAAAVLTGLLYLLQWLGMDPKTLFA